MREEGGVRNEIGRAMPLSVSAPPFQIYPATSDFSHIIPDFSPRHSRESGNPDAFSQARCLKLGMNSSQRIHSPLMGLQG